MLTLLLPLLASPVLQESWTALPLPELCQETSPAVHLPALPGAGHIQLEGEPRDSRRGARALLSAPDLAALLSNVATAAGKNIELFPYAPPLLVRGSDENLLWTRATLAAIETAAGRHRIELSAWLVPASGAQLPLDGEGLPAGTLSWTAEALPGEELAFGRREGQDFVSSYDVEVSTDAGVAAPRVGAVFGGNTLHLSASRVDDGTRYHLRGLLDLAEVSAIETFDPDTPDLGQLEQPRVRSVSVAFSGVAASGELLRVELEGAPLSRPDWTLLVRCSVAAEPTGPAAAAAGPVPDWRSIDVTLLSGRGRSLPYLDAGAGLAGQAGLDLMTPRSAAISASGVLSAVQAGSRSRRASSARSLAGQAPLQVCEGLLLIAAESAEEGLAQRAAEFVRSVCAPRLGASGVELQSGGFHARFPIAEGEAARVTVGEERTLLTGYSAEIAPSTWMPSPIVERAFDGLAWQGRRNGQRVACTTWISTTAGIEVRDRRQTQLGAVQLPRRSLRGAERSVESGSGRIELLAPLEDAPGLSILVDSF
jgi:hypothetical protein